MSEIKNPLTLWFRNTPPEEVEKLKEILKSGSLLLDKLYEICYNRSIELKKVSKPDYDNPSWSHKQAHLNGQLEELELILKLIQR